MRSFFVLGLFLFTHQCGGRAVDLKSLQAHFSKPEYLPSGDGWAEARRRRLLKEHFRRSDISIDEWQVNKPGAASDKYKLVHLGIAGRGATDLKVTYALQPNETGGVRAVQAGLHQKCDAALFDALSGIDILRARYRKVWLTMDSTCRMEGLTPRLAGAN